MENLELALKYAKAGWYLFPSIYGVPRHKRKSENPAKTHIPLAKWSTESSNDINKIKEWATKHKDIYFCIDLKKSGLNVIDIDTKNNKQGDRAIIYLQFKYDILPETLEVQTPSGGTHYLFNGGFKGQTCDKLAKGVDTPTMIPAPGSNVIGKGIYRIKNNRPVAPLPHWTAELIASVHTEKDTREPAVPLDQPHNLKAAKEFLMTAEPALQGDGADALTYLTACKVRDFGLSEQMAVDYMLSYWYYPSCEPNNKPEFIEFKVRNAYAYALNQPGSTLPEADFEPVTTEGEPVKIQPFDPEIMMKKAMFKTTEYSRIPLPEREHYLSPWLTSDSISLITAYRGTGKTWFSMSLAHAVATGTPFGKWKSPTGKGQKTVFLDGEMAAISIQQRFNLIGNSPNLYIYSDSYASRQGFMKANLTNPRWRRAMKKMLIDMKAKVFILDNLVSLSTGIDENSSKEWSPVNEWLISLRAAGISIVMIHHTNKQGGQRGTSHREDPIDIGIMLNRVPGHNPHEGARFVCHFNKSREVPYEASADIADTQFWLKTDLLDPNCTEAKRLLSVAEETGGKQAIKSLIDKKSGKVRKLRWEIVSSLVKQSRHDILALKDKGLKHADIADTCEVSRQYVSKVIKEAIEEGLLSKHGRLTGEGLDFVISRGSLEED